MDLIPLWTIQTKVNGSWQRLESFQDRSLAEKEFKLLKEYGMYRLISTSLPDD